MPTFPRSLDGVSLCNGWWSQGGPLGRRCEVTAAKSGLSPFRRRYYTVERQYQGSVFDVANARRFARCTASWWGVDAQRVDQMVDRLARRAVCNEQPGFRVSLSLDGDDVRVRVEGVGGDVPPLKGRASVESPCSHDRGRRR